jgi:hypothetical protein
MPQSTTCSASASRPMMASLRELIWIQEPHFLGWVVPNAHGCSGRRDRL